MIALIIIASVFLGLQSPKFLFRPIQYVKKRFNLLRLKPFDCEACSGLWISVIASLCLGANVVTIILIATVVFNIIKAICQVKYFINTFDEE